LGVDFHVDGAAYRAAVFDAGRLDSLQDGVELLLADAKTVVLDGEILIGVYEVQGQAIVEVDGGERPCCRLAPWNAQELGQKLCRGGLVARRNYEVIELYGHVGFSCAPEPFHRGCR
jgi:hypothetical protein